MCGIVGYTGHLQAAPILLDGLSKLEYRGYDSAGLAVRNGEKKTEIVETQTYIERFCIYLISLIDCVYQFFCFDCFSNNVLLTNKMTDFII